MAQEGKKTLRLGEYNVIVRLSDNLLIICFCCTTTTTNTTESHSASYRSSKSHFFPERRPPRSLRKLRRRETVHVLSGTVSGDSRPVDPPNSSIAKHVPCRLWKLKLQVKPWKLQVHTWQRHRPCNASTMLHRRCFDRGPAMCPVSNPDLIVQTVYGIGHSESIHRIQTLARALQWHGASWNFPTAHVLCNVWKQRDCLIFCLFSTMFLGSFYSHIGQEKAEPRPPLRWLHGQ